MIVKEYTVNEVQELMKLYKNKNIYQLFVNGEWDIIYPKNCTVTIIGLNWDEKRAVILIEPEV
jgi:hypothetical protein